MNKFHGKWKYSEYVSEGTLTGLNGRDFLVTPKNARLIAAAPAMYNMLKRIYRALMDFEAEGTVEAINAMDLAKLVRESAKLLNRIDGEEDEE